MFVFNATLVQYNLHYVTKKPTAVQTPRLLWSLRNKRLHRLFIALGTAMILISFFHFHVTQFIVLAVLGVITLLYSFPVRFFGAKKRLKDYGIAKIVVLSLTWTIVTVWLPVIGMEYDSVTFFFVLIKRFLFMFVLCMVFDIRDRAADEAEGIRTIPVIMGTARAYRFAFYLLALFALIAVGESMLLSHLFWIPLLLSAVVTAFVIQYSKRNMSDVTCLLLVDGMMLLQSVLVFLFIQLNL